MSAGTGVLHSEYNHGGKLLRFFQIWIFPDKKGYAPNYGDFRFKLEDRYNKWLPIATYTENAGSAAPIKIHADINAYAAIISPGVSLDFEVSAGRQAYLVLIEGRAGLQGKDGSSAGLSMRDAAEITGESFTISAQTSLAAEASGEAQESHVLVIEMAADAGITAA
jgi:redox-sensitive bicupin YhaK (pirin superfamily)